jgi:soluble lytic murein transglycosylase-like protein
MRLAALCLVVCFVTGASATSSDPPAVPAGEVNSPSDERSRTSLTISNSSSELEEPARPTTGAPKLPHVPLSRIELCEAAVAVAKANSLPVGFFTRLIHQESGFRPNAVSPVGAQGIAQFMPRTASSRALANPFEPIGALAASAKFLIELADQFGNLGLAAAAYNAGPGRVQEWLAKRK